jgi:hypothetical protein
VKGRLQRNKMGTGLRMAVAIREAREGKAINGKFKPTIKSQLLPEMQKGPAIDVVALNYDNIVMNNEKDVLIEFYTQ